MKIHSSLFALSVASAVFLLSFEAVSAPKVERVFRDPLNTRGNLNITRVQPVDEASWLWHPDDNVMSSGPELISHLEKSGDDVVPVMVFRKRFAVKPGEGPVLVDVSADERFYLTCDGVFVARGPNRADIQNWQYQTYRLELDPGEHELRAVVLRLGTHAPLAQLSWRGGFVLKADGVYDARLTTGKTDWEVGWFKGMRPAGADNGVWGTGSQFVVTGAGPYAVEPETWVKAMVARGPGSRQTGHKIYGGRTQGWMLFPTQLPDQTEHVVRPGEIRAASHEAEWRSRHTYFEDETVAPEVARFNALLKGETNRVVIPARTSLQLAWHLGRYICAYPELVVSGGKGAKFSWNWTESSRNRNDHMKGDRAVVVGKYLEGYGDTFMPDGRDHAVFSTPWFRCGLWCRIDIKTGDEPLIIEDMRLIESRYPLEMESAFASPDDPSLDDIRRISLRALQMCSHEMFFDCPYYEQQMYPGDTRVEMITLGAVTRDDRLIKRAIDLFSLALRDDGQCPFNFPTRGTQEGLTYTLCYLAMFGDYAINHDDLKWLRSRLPAMRAAMAGCEQYENAEGLIEHTPGWNFMDWTVEWNDNAVPGSDHGFELNSFANLFWLLDMRSAAIAERALGNELQAQYWEAKAVRLKAAIIRTFWDEQRALIADTPAKKTFSEHSQSLAIVTDLLPSEKRDACFAHLIADSDLARTTVYFNYYLFEAYFKMGRADLFLKRLDLWREYVRKNLTTTQEAPDVGTDRKLESRSDCHAWGAHPIYFMQAGLAGIRSAAPGFASVEITPVPGQLGSLTARHPHPKGYVDVELVFKDGSVTGRVSTPVPGVFRYGEKVVELKAGENNL